MSTIAEHPQPPPSPRDDVRSEPPRPAWWMTKRFVLAAVGIVLLSAGATAVIALNEVGKLVEALGQTKAVKISTRLLAASSKGAPETLLLVGNDQRPAPKNNPNGFVIPHSNEMLLVRIDPSKPTISMLSIPRELQVMIYPHNAAPELTRINAAYGIGGASLMTETIKRVLGVSINHVFVLTFPRFRKAVDELGCVYMGVDRRYYHVNEPGGEQYFEINLQPGYQRLCGREALEFVANRHEDTSLTRDARDQRFLLEIKGQYGGTLFESREKFERILGRTVETDLHGTESVLNLLELLVQSAGKPVRQVPFQVNLLPSYDTASPQQIHESVQSFLTGTAPIHRQRLGGSRAPSHTHHAAPAHHTPPVSSALTPTSASEIDQARSQAPALPFPLEYPKARLGTAGSGPDTLRLYDIRDQSRHLHPIYAIVIDRGVLGQFYDVQGTTWGSPPLLSGPSQTVTVGRRTYELFYAGEQVKAIAWREAGAVYWIENTLTNSISPQQMLAMAEQTTPVIGTANAGGPPTTTSPAGLTLAPRSTSSTSTLSELGAAIGLVGLAALAALAVVLVARQRELETLREQVRLALALEARRRPALAAGVLPPASARLSAPSIPGATSSPPSAPTAASAAPQRTIHRARRRWHPGALLGAGALLLLALALVLVLQLRGNSTSTPSPSRPSATVAVAVFNATSRPGAAHRIADVLRAGRVHVGPIGDINASLGHGTYVLYPPGTSAQAQRVAALLGSPAPTVTPIQPQMQQAVGHRDEIVVVLD